jgi:hypothetical protein
MFAVVVEETVKQILSALSDNDHEGRSDVETEHVERLEMAQIRLEAVLEVSVGWQIKDPSLLRWRRKLKREAQECDEALHRCKQRIVEDEEKQRAARSISFPQRLAHATKACLSSVIAGHRDESSTTRDDARRFEWFADGASDFLRFVELGGTPRRYMFFDPLIGHLLAGKELRYRLVRGSQHHVLCMRPVSFEGRGLEAKFLYVYEDDDAPENNFCLGLMLRLSESMDVVGIAIKCLQQLLVTPHFKSTAEAAMREIAQLPTQDFSWVPYVESGHKEHWNRIHGILSQVSRPNPNCCKHHHHAPKPCSSNSSNMHAAKLPLPHVSLEPVIEMYFVRIIPAVSSRRSARRRKLVQGEARSPSKELFPHLKLAIHYSPHGVPEDMASSPSVGSSTIEFIDGKQQYVMHKDMSLEQLDEIMLPKAIDCLNRKPEASLYQLSWKSKHETAYLRLEKTGMVKMTRDDIGDDPSRDRGAMIQRRQDPKLEAWLEVFTDFLKPWVALAPERLQGPVLEWIKKADEM